MNGVLLLGQDDVIESRAKRHKVALERGEAPALPFAKTLIATPGVRVPWDLMPAAWGLLERWDAAVPLWRYDSTAASAGTAAERKATQKVVRDLRVLLHAYELLFIRRNEAGEALVAAWIEECQGGADKRLAFLRALYRVKPRLCVLPTSWLAEVRGPVQRPIVAQPAAVRPAERALSVKPPNMRQPLVTVELSPGRLVKCHKGDEEKVLEQFRRQRQRR